jgi:two-component system response regulator AlgR
MSTTLRVFIVDDETLARERLKELLNDCAAELPLSQAGEAANGRDALESLTVTPADVVLVDIRMPQMDGIELARHLAHLSPPPAVIFTTAYDSYAIQAFDLHAVDYLLKPIRRTRLLEALQRVRPNQLTDAQLRQLQREPRQHLSIHERGKIVLVPLDEVLFLRAEQKYVTVRTAAQEYLSEESLTALEQEFAARFVRIHRNCLVAKAAIVAFERANNDAGSESHWVVKLGELEERLPISRRQQFVVKEFS